MRRPGSEDPNGSSSNFTKWFQLYEKVADVEGKVQSISEKLNLMTVENIDKFSLARYR